MVKYLNCIFILISMLYEGPKINALHSTFVLLLMLSVLLCCFLINDYLLFIFATLYAHFLLCALFTCYVTFAHLSPVNKLAIISYSEQVPLYLKIQSSFSFGSVNILPLGLTISGTYCLFLFSVLL